MKPPVSPISHVWSARRARGEASAPFRALARAAVIALLGVGAAACGSEQRDSAEPAAAVEGETPIDVPVREPAGDAQAEPARPLGTEAPRAREDAELAQSGEAGLEGESELLAELDDPDPELRAEAIWALALDENDEAIEEQRARVIALLAADPDAIVRVAAAERLGEVHTPETVGALIQALSDPDPEVVLAAIDSLDGSDDPRLPPALEALRASPNEDIRDAAEIALAPLIP